MRRWTAQAKTRMASRNPSRLVLGGLLIVSAFTRLRARTRPADPRRILIAHHLLLGDTLMLTPLLARLRERYPHAEIFMTTPKALVPLYAGRPYGVHALPYDPRDAATLIAWARRAPFDLAFLPADNRFSALARALRAQWIVGFAGDTPGYKNWFVDEFVPFADKPISFADLSARLVDDVAPAPYAATAWPAPAFAPFARPTANYCVLHAGASNQLKQWPSGAWRELADELTARGYQVVLSGGRGEESIVAQIDPEARYRSVAGQLDLAQLWQLVRGAALLVSVDTGVAHMGRMTATPTVVLFGPGSPAICGAGDFWRNVPYVPLNVPDVACRDQNIVFRRPVPALQHCVRLYGECTRNICLERLTLAQVLAGIAAVTRAPSLTN